MTSSYLVLQLIPISQQYLLLLSNMRPTEVSISGLQLGGVINQDLQLSLQSHQVILKRLVLPDQTLDSLQVSPVVIAGDDGTLLCNP